MFCLKKKKRNTFEEYIRIVDINYSNVLFKLDRWRFKSSNFKKIENEF